MAALDKQSAGDFCVLIVDNGSADGSVQWIEENLPGFVRIRPGEKLPAEPERRKTDSGCQGCPIYLMEMGENTGFSGAVNAGIRASCTEYVILLNNDTEPEPDYIRELEKAMEGSPRIFSVSSKMIQLYEKRLMDDAGDLYTVIGWAFQR